MSEWKNVTDTFSEAQRRYNGKYLEIDEVYQRWMSHMKYISIMIYFLELYMLKQKMFMKSEMK